MAEEVKQEVKQEEKVPEKKNILPVVSKVVLGLVFLALGAAAIYVWRLDLLSLIRGCVGPFLILAGIIALAIARD